MPNTCLYIDFVLIKNLLMFLRFFS